MRIHISGKGIHRREVSGIEKLRTLPSDWYAFTNLELIEAGAMPRQIDVVIVLDDRILIADLKDWNGKITSDGDRWFQNGRSVDTSPVKKILENVRIMAGLLSRFLAKTAKQRGTVFNRWQLPLVEGCVITTGRCDIRELPDLEKPRVFQIDEFCRIIQAPRERLARLASPSWIDKADPYIASGSRWRDDLARFFGASEGYFKPLEKRYGEYRVVSEQTYQHTKQIYSEYDVEETSVGRGFGLLRLWDFSKAEPRYASEEARIEIAGREQAVIAYLIERQPQLETAVIRPRIADPAKGVHYWEIFERRRQLRRLSEFLVSEGTELTTPARVELARSLLSHVAAMHRIRAAHLDIGNHSVWLELPSVVRLSHLVAASYPELVSLGSKRFEFLANDTVLPEHIIEQIPDNFRKDVFLLGVVIHSLLFGLPPKSLRPGEPPSWSSDADETGKLAHLYSWFAKSLDVSSADRFADGQAMLDSFNDSLRVSDLGPNAIERLQRFRRWKSVRELYREYPEASLIKETDRIIIWTSERDGIVLLVKAWRRACWGEELSEAPRIARFCEQAEDLILANPTGIASLRDIGYLSDHLVLVQVFVEGDTLATSRISHQDRWSQSATVIQFLLTLASTIDGLHSAGFAHGDLSPTNIIVSWNGLEPAPVLVDLLDFGPATEGHIITSAYAPHYEVGTKERDRYGLLKICEALLSQIELDSKTSSIVTEAIQVCYRTPPALSTLAPLIEALEAALSPPAVETLPSITISFPGLPPGPLVSDEGRYHIWLHSPHKVTITGNTEELVVGLDPRRDHQIVSLRREGVAQSLVAIAEKRSTTGFEGQITAISGVTDTSQLADLIVKARDQQSLHDQAPSAEEDKSKAGDQERPLDEDVIAHEYLPFGELPTIDVAELWQTLLKVEEEQITRGIAELDSSYSRDRRRHAVVLQETFGTIDFTRDDKVSVELRTRTGNWVPIGVLDLDLSSGKQVSIDASGYRARDGAQLCQAGADLRFRSMMETDSRKRRLDATNRLLKHQTVIPDLAEYLTCKRHTLKNSGIVIDREVITARYGLNGPQVEAFARIVACRPLGLLQGPPGTGKTKFIAALAHYLLSNNIVSNVLIASQSHEAVNNATEGILRLFRRDDMEPSLIRVGQEGSVSELLKPYHSARVEGQYREKFRAGLKSRFLLAGRQVGVSAEFASDVFFLEATVLPIFQQYRSLLNPIAEPQEDAEARARSLGETLVTLQHQMELGDTADWNTPDAYEDVFELLMDRHRVGSAELGRKMRGIARLTRDWMGSVAGTRRSFEEFLANTRQIVSGTCVGLGRSSLGLSSARFDLVIVDEAARCTPSELAVPIQAGRWIVLVGDHLQLEPFHEPSVLKEVQRRLRVPMKEVVRSDFERAFGSRYGKTVGQTLTVQYRMLPRIGRLVSEAFYDGRLEHGRTEDSAPESIWPASLKTQLTWVATDKLGSSSYQTKESGGGRSLTNPVEVNAIADLLRELDSHQPFMEWLMKQAPEEKAIGIICMYAAQSRAIRQKLRTLGLSGTLLNACSIDTVDSYQGKENLLVILSLVRNNEAGPRLGATRTIATGFMARGNRINVAISRAMDKLVIVGALHRWPPDSPMATVASIYDAMCEEGIAKLTELSDDELALGDIQQRKKRRASKQPRRRAKADVE